MDLFLFIPCVIVVFGFQFVYSARTPSKRIDARISGSSLANSKRQIQHMSTGVVIALLRIYIVPHGEATAILFASGILVFLLHLFRKVNQPFQALVKEHFGDLLRPDELAGKCPGCVYFLFGTSLSFHFNGPVLGLLSLLHLSFGDPAASYAGRVPAIAGVRNVRFANGKSLFGIVGCATVCAIATRFYLNSSATHSLASGLASALSEFAIPGDVVDDNLAMPLLSGLLHKLFH